MQSTDNTRLDIPTYIKHFERMIRNAENNRMAGFLKELIAKLSDPSHVPTGKWNQPGEWGHSDLKLVPAWIRLDCYDESRVLECMSFEQKLQWWKLKQDSKRRFEAKQNARLGNQPAKKPARRRTATTRTSVVPNSKGFLVLKALESSEWITMKDIMARTGLASTNAVQIHMCTLRKRGYVIECRWSGPTEFRMTGARKSLKDKSLEQSPESPKDKSVELTHARILTALESGVWISAKDLIESPDRFTKQVMSKCIHSLRRLGYVIERRFSDPTTRTTEYRLDKNSRNDPAPQGDCENDKSSTQVPANRPADITPVQGIEEGHDHESGSTNHNPGNGEEVSRSIKRCRSIQSSEAFSYQQTETRNGTGPLDA